MLESLIIMYTVEPVYKMVSVLGNHLSKTASLPGPN